MALKISGNNESGNMVYSFGLRKPKELIVYSKSDDAVFIMPEGMMVLNLGCLATKEEQASLEVFLNTVAKVIEDIRERGKIVPLSQLRENPEFSKCINKIIEE